MFPMPFNLLTFNDIRHTAGYKADENHNNKREMSQKKPAFQMRARKKFEASPTLGYLP